MEKSNFLKSNILIKAALICTSIVFACISNLNAQDVKTVSYANSEITDYVQLLNPCIMRLSISKTVFLNRDQMLAAKEDKIANPVKVKKAAKHHKGSKADKPKIKSNVEINRIVNSH